MSAAENIEKLVGKFCKVKQSSVTTSEQMDKNVLEDALTAYEKSRHSRTVVPEKNTWSTAMRNPITQYAAVAAVIIMAAALSITFLSKSATPAYAIDQTVQASHSARYIRMKMFIEKEFAGQMYQVMAEKSHGAEAAKHPRILQLATKAIQAYQDRPLEPMEFWAEFEPSGQLKNLRMIKPAWLSQDDGKTIVVWQDNKAKVWMEKKNILLILKDKIIADQIRQSVEGVDPKLAVAKLQSQQAQGVVDLHIDEPTDKSGPIVVTAILADDAPPPQRMVLFVDQATKLVNSTECYQLRDGEYRKMLTNQYSNYNQPIASEMFTLTDIPADAMVVDQTAQDVGLVQGDLTDNQIAVKITRQFLEALMKKDFAEAGRLFSGTPAKNMERLYGKIKFVRIVSISEPVSSGYGGLFVSPKVEIEKDGQIVIWKTIQAHVRRVHGQPERWEITGGFLGI